MPDNGTDCKLARMNKVENTGKKEIVLTNLSVGYSHKAVATKLAATFAAGRLTCLLGRNGVGKSTLLKTIAGTLTPVAGSVTIGGIQTASLSRQERARTVSVVLTQRPDVRGITVAQMVAMGRQPYTNFLGKLQSADRDAMAEAIRLTAIGPLQERMVQTLSDGEWQKTMIAKALAQHTPVILLDEPTAFLDYPSKVEVLSLLGQLAHEQGKTIVLSTHEVELAERFADTLLYMTNQEITEWQKDKFFL